MKTKIVSIVALAAVTLLSGCVTNPSIQSGGNDFIGKAIQVAAAGIGNGINNAMQPDAVAAFRASAVADKAVLSKAFSTLTAANTGIPKSASSADVVTVTFTRGPQSWPVEFVRGARWAVPDEAAKTKNKDLAEVIQVMTHYVTSVRPESSVTHMVVVAPDSAEREWIATQMKKAGAKNVDRIEGQYVAIGFATPGLTLNRAVN